jgi:hypothetical protein
MNYANQLGYTDVRPYEVVKTISGKTLEVREMDAVEDDSFKKEFVPGGFSALCTNNYAQKWFITSNNNNGVIRIRLSKNNGWQDKYGRLYDLSDEPRKFYDYNF